MNNAILTIRDEHRSISAVLHALQQLAKDAEDPKVTPRFDALRAMIYYIDQYPERLHHPKEEQFLFSRLESRAPQAKPLLDELRAQHKTGAQLIRDLEQALVGLEVGWAGGARAFRAAVEAYAQFHWKHMHKEESEVLPLAERHLTAEDWREVDEGFSGNQDPIADLREHDFEKLFTRIVNLAPEPIGLGERWKKSASA